MRQFLGGQTFRSTKIPNADLSGKTMIVTGSYTGLGFEAAKHLYANPLFLSNSSRLTLSRAQLKLSKLILACRNMKKGKAAKTAILAQIKSSTAIEVWEIDMSNYASVLAFRKRVRSELPRLAGFIANAGVEMHEFAVAEGLEMTLTVNVVSTMLVAMEVLPKIKESSRKYGGPTTLTIVGPMVHCLGKDAYLETPPADEDTFEILSDPKTADMADRYNLSKLILHLCCMALTQRVDSREVVLNWVSPGWCASELKRYKGMNVLRRQSLLSLEGLRKKEVGLWWMLCWLARRAMGNIFPSVRSSPSPLSCAVTEGKSCRRGSGTS
jgi:retinol dehydrogenase-12